MERKVRTPQGRMLREINLKRRRRVSKRGNGTVSQRIYRRAGNRAVRVKRWGKSPPRSPRGGWQDKPLPVQGKIGGWVARPIAAGMSHSIAGQVPGVELARKGVEINDCRIPRKREAQNPAYRPQS